jgi:DNA-binding NarL/FixJ family response regulator
VGRNLDEQGPAATRFFELEYALDTPAQYRDLLRSRTDTALIHADAHGRDNSSAAVREHLTEMGVGQELRVLFHHHGAAWGGAGLMRSTGSATFEADEIDFARRIAPIVTNAVRTALVRSIAVDLAVPTENGPAVIVVETEQIVEATPAAVTWLAALARSDIGHGVAPTVVRAVAAHASAGRTVAQRARCADGTWVVLRGAPLSQGRAIVTIEVAGPPEVASMINAALGLTGREIDVVAAVLKGLSTKEIATELHLSTYTVQDHLKSVFTKAHVNSRRELVAEVFFGIYAPRLGTPVGADGFFQPS